MHHAADLVVLGLASRACAELAGLVACAARAIPSPPTQDLIPEPWPLNFGTTNICDHRCLSRYAFLFLDPFAANNDLHDDDSFFSFLHVDTQHSASQSSGFGSTERAVDDCLALPFLQLLRGVQYSQHITFGNQPPLPDVFLV